MVSDDLAGTFKALFAAAPPGQPAVLHLPDGLGLKVLTRRDKRLVLAWQANGRRLKAATSEEIGEDAGFFDPQIQPWACAESPKAMLITEGYTGPLCEHEFKDRTHVKADRWFAWMFRCARCGLELSQEHARRGQRSEYLYDGWELRQHIYQRWSTCGPVPGQLTPKAHHHGAGAA